MQGEELDWHRQAEALYFEEHLRVTEVCRIVGKTRKYVSPFLQSCERYEEEQVWRKEEAARKRREYQRQWDRDNRAYVGTVTADTMRREHDLAALELSREIYH